MKKFMDAIHAKVSSINRTIGQLESPYNPAPSARHKECHAYMVQNKDLLYTYIFLYKCILRKEGNLWKCSYKPKRVEPM